MKLYIILTSHKAEIILREGGVERSRREFSVDNDVSQKLLSEIDLLLHEVELNPTQIECVEYSAVDAGFTTTRIGQVIADTYNFALKNNKDISGKII